MFLGQAGARLATSPKGIGRSFLSVVISGFPQREPNKTPRALASATQAVVLWFFQYQKLLADVRRGLICLCLLYIPPCLNTSYTTESEHDINYIYSSISFIFHGFIYLFFFIQKSKSTEGQIGIRSYRKFLVKWCLEFTYSKS